LIFASLYQDKEERKKTAPKGCKKNHFFLKINRSVTVTPKLTTAPTHAKTIVLKISSDKIVGIMPSKVPDAVPARNETSLPTSWLFRLGGCSHGLFIDGNLAYRRQDRTRGRNMRRNHGNAVRYRLDTNDACRQCGQEDANGAQDPEKLRGWGCRPLKDCHDAKNVSVWSPGPESFGLLWFPPIAVEGYGGGGGADWFPPISELPVRGTLGPPISASFALASPWQMHAVKITRALRPICVAFMIIKI
jgi:hypothetical protein